MRVGVGTVVDACSAFDGNLTVEPPDATTITALLDGVRHHSSANGVDGWPGDNDPGYTRVRAGIIKMTRFCADQHTVARARAAAYAGLVPVSSAPTPPPETDESMLKNKDENAERLYASAEVLYNRSWASDVRPANAQLLATHIGFKRATLKMAAINSGQYGVLDAIVRSGQLALTHTEDRVSLSEAETTVDLRRLVPSLTQINRAIDSLVIAGQDPISASQTNSGHFGFVTTANGREQIQMDLTAAELAKSAFLALANVNTAAQLQFIFTNTFVRLLDLKMKNHHSCSAGIQELIYHSGGMTPSAPPAAAPAASSESPAGTPERAADKRKTDDSEVAKLRKELKAAENARDHQSRTCEAMKVARDRRAQGKGSGRGGGGYYNNNWGGPPPNFNGGGYNNYQGNQHHDQNGGKGGGRPN